MFLCLYQPFENYQKPFVHYQIFVYVHFMSDLLYCRDCFWFTFCHLKQIWWTHVFFCFISYNKPCLTSIIMICNFYFGFTNYKCLNWHLIFRVFSIVFLSGIYGRSDLSKMFISYVQYMSFFLGYEGNFLTMDILLRFFKLWYVNISLYKCSLAPCTISEINALFTWYALSWVDLVAYPCYNKFPNLVILLIHVMYQNTHAVHRRVKKSFEIEGRN